MAPGLAAMVTQLRVDLLSDTVTRPTAEMREAIAGAQVGDDVFGEDPTVAALEERIAGLLGHEAGLFTPSGSMAGQLAVRVHVPPGQELLCDDQAHVVRAELGAAAVLSGVTTRTWSAPRGLLDPAEPLRLLATGVGPYQVETALVVVENTHNFGGGTIQPLDALTRLRTATRDRGVRVHLDGARLWHAHVATGIPLTTYGAVADTVAVCLSKGLGAPVGSVLVGTRQIVEQARVWRKRFGGGMRQAGILAAAGLYAVDHHLTRLADDHRRARRAADACAAAAPGVVVPEHVETNILLLDVSSVGWSAASFVTAALAYGVRGYAVGPGTVRLVWHLDIDDAATETAVDVLTRLLRSGPDPHGADAPPPTD